MVCLSCGHKIGKYGFRDKRSHFKECPLMKEAKTQEVKNKAPNLEGADFWNDLELERRLGN